MSTPLVTAGEESPGILPGHSAPWTAGDLLAEAQWRLRHAEARQEAIFKIAALAGSDTNAAAMLRELHGIVASVLDSDSFAIAMLDAHGSVARLVGGADGREVHWATPGSLEELDDPLLGALIGQGQASRGDFDGRHCLGVPIPGDGQGRGALLTRAVASRPPYTEADQAFLAFVAEQVRIASARWSAQTREDDPMHKSTQDLMQEVLDRQRSELLQSALFSVAELSNTPISLGQYYAAVHDIVGDALDCRNICIAQLNAEDDELHFPYFVNDRQPIPSPRKLGKGMLEYVLRTHAPLRFDSAEDSDREALATLVEDGEISRYDQSLGAWLGVPVMRANRVVGVLSVETYEPGLSYTERDEEFLTFIAYQVGNGLERQQAAASLRAANATLEQRVSERTRQLQKQMEARELIEQQLKHETLHDFLTGLPNRAYLCDRLARSLAGQVRDPDKTFAVLFMDLDRFKVINDSAGHIVGDSLLKEVAQRLAACVRAPDMVARLGGDEFAILVENVTQVETAVRVARRVIAAMKDPVNVDGKELFTSVSIGIAISDPAYRVAEELLRDADIAMYRAKGNDQQRFELFNENLHLEAIRVLEVEGDLRRAITRQEFVPYFQEIVRLEDGRVIGYESLLRWNHPERGVLAPDAFLAIAEASGSLEAIDWQMFDLTCAAVARRLKAGQYVNLNFSPRHFRDRDMDARLLSLLDAHGVAPNQVRIEVTEGTLIENPDQVSDIISRLREAGVLTSLDDFGTGYSSLSYLHRFPLHAVKIDRSFVTPLGQPGKNPSEAVVRAILALSKSQGLDVIAEGVETVAQRDALLALGCTMGQGYLYSRPLPMEALA